ncbi:axotactin-like isoform X1 [Liolophura sinensis]|uniref:axotactin-like isoform X1 n=1 Tax=Liolophura sinensis TaxID=3198878 RepID=UPI003158A886
MVLVENEENARLMVQLEFRTVLHEAVLVHTELIAPDKEVGYDIGDLEVWISNGEVMLHYKPSSRFPNFTQDLSIGEKVNDAMWHSLQLTYVNRQVWLRLDGKQIISEKYRRPLNHRGNIVIGHGLRRYKSGFVGCMRHLKIQGRTIDPLVMVQSKQAVGVVLDGCDLKDRCKGLNLCEHDSVCVSDWEGVVCDCVRVPYVGKTCHFANYLRTCDEYYQAGWRGSGVYRVDPDGNGPLSPVYVNCDMEHMVAQEGYGLTVIEHNLPKNFTAREIGEPGRKVKISYRGVDRFTLKALTERSLGCRQHISYLCKDAKLSLGKLTWFKTTDGRVLDYLGTTDHGDCHCANNNTCIQPGTACNCDADLHKWTEDRGFNTIKEQLPITEMVFLKDKGQGVVTLGPLECWGNIDHQWETAVTFKTTVSYVTAPAWSTGDLEISFKTDRASATLLHQSSPQTSTDFFTMTLLEDHKLEISYSVGSVERRIVLQTKAKFSSGLWNQVRVEHDRTNARFTLNEASEMIDLQKGERLARFNGAMFIGSPGTKLSGSNDGIIGCVRGVVYNNKQLDLVKYAEEKSDEVEAGCTASCQSSPCQHGATCEEAWGQYTCHCLNTWSHLGSNCQQNIDENMATIDGAEHSYLEVNVTTPRVLSGTLVFSFRTFQANALLFYMHDHFNNFIQLELRNAREILLLYNSLTYIIDEFIPVRDLNDGNWKQVIIEKLDSGWLKLQCGKISRVIQQKRALLRTYLSKPFNSRESVRPIRGELPPDPFIKLYVGGVPKEMKTKITPATLHGCVRGFRSNEYIFDLEGSAEYQNGTSVGCIAGCEKQGCKNGGLCVELWEGEYQCDCMNSYYTGITCQTEPSGIFDGSTVVRSKVKLDATSLAASSSTERLTVHFTANSTANTERVVLAFVYSSRTGDYILVYLTRLGDVVVETDLGTGTYIVKKSGSFVDDQRHKLEYKRRQTELSLTLDPFEGNKSSVIDLAELDQDRPSTVVHPDYTLDRVDTIMVGGVVLNNPRFSNYQNFTGCLSDVVYYPLANSVLKFQPLKELHQVPQHDTVEAWGEEPVPCSPTPPVMEKPQQEIPSSPSDSESRPEIVTMPPWDKGPAEVELIQPIQTPNITNITRIVPIITSSTDYLTIIIAVTLVAFLLIVALVIALLLARLRRRRERYDVQKQPAEYHELKMPLKSAEPESPQNHHEANGYHFPEMSPEDEALLNPPLNRKTNRPASSISEVLEEMERRRKAKVAGLDPDVVVLTDSPVSAQSMQMHGEGDLEWDPQADRVPLSCKNKSEEAAEASSHRSDSPVRVEFNGDSGYEAGSKPEVEEENTASPDKLYKYDLAGYNSESLLKGDSVKTRLISEEAETAC